MRQHLLNQAGNSRILLALDGVAVSKAENLANELSSIVAGGKATDLIDQVGAHVLSVTSFKIKFLDPKLNDIPATVGNRVTRYAGHADILTVHASMSGESLQAAARAGQENSIAVVAVTVLTSISPEECFTIFGDSPENIVTKFALRAKDAGLTGVVCSALEAPLVRQLWPDALIITPGVRSTSTSTNDQERTATPSEAIRSGADFVVCGRQITSLPTPSERQAEIAKINREINSVL